MIILFAALSNGYKHLFDPFEILFLTNVVVSSHLLCEYSHCVFDLVRVFFSAIKQVKEAQQNFNVSIVHS